jgi:stage II sporulation protein R
MKKIIIGCLVIITFTMFQELSIDEKIIPDEAIRFRVLANSNSTYDLDIKEKVSAKLQGDMYTYLKDTKSISEARNIIRTNIDNFGDTVSSVLKNENYNLDYNVEFGTHYFPKKEYKGVIYDEGYYESLLVKLGKGEGDNWWCVLFPPLCLLEASESNEVEYKFFVQEIIDKFL